VTTEAGSQTEEVNWPKPALAWYVNGVLMLAFVLAFIDRQIIALLVGPIQEDLNISDTEVSLLGGFAFVFFYTFLGIPIGRIADRRRRVPVELHDRGLRLRPQFFSAVRRPGRRRRG
jgi:MFS family permease